MFTDQPTTPLHVEALIEFLRAGRALTRREIQDAMQPNNVHHDQAQSKAAINAAKELLLIAEEQKEEKKLVQLLPVGKGRKTLQECVLDALDLRVLASTGVEKYFALYYAFLLGQASAADKDPESQVLAFNRQVFEDQPQENPFNTTKRGALYRWFIYSGLGWHDPQGVFCCNPYSRIERKLQLIFDGEKQLAIEEFMDALAMHCPEIDGGKIFEQANKHQDRTPKQCTLGLSQALIELHLDKNISLDCPKDSGGWSIALADPPVEGTIEADRISYVAIGKVKKS